MSFGCVPVVTNSTSHPETIGKCGFLVPYADAEATVNAIEEAVNSPGKIRCVIERFNDNFTLEKRRPDLLKLAWGIIDERNK